MARTRANDRKERVPFGIKRKKMNLGEEIERKLKVQGKIPRWFNDTKDRIRRALDAGYEFVEADDNTKVGDAKELQDEDRRIRKVVGSWQDNKPIYAYLMAISKKYYEEDKLKKREINQRVEKTIKAGQPDGVPNHGVGSSHGSTYVKNVNYTP